jgi:hypothetical protein
MKLPFEAHSSTSYGRSKTKKPAALKKSVGFGGVHVVEFTRAVGGQGVPGSRSWPLGLSRAKHRTFVCCETMLYV